MNAHYFLYDSSKRESGLIINQMTNSIYMAISEAKKGAGHGRRARSCFWGLMTEFVIGAAQTGTTSRNTDRHRSLSLSQTKSSHPKSLNRLVRWFVCVRLTDFRRLATWAVASHVTNVMTTQALKRTRYNKQEQIMSRIKLLAIF